MALAFFFSAHVIECLMKKTAAILLILISIPSLGYPADPEEALFDNIEVAYFGETFTHPGFFAGSEWTISGGEWFLWFASGTLGFYVHPRNHTGIFLTAETGFRASFVFGGTFGVHGGLGYLHTFAGGPVYEMSGGIPVQIVDYGEANLVIPVFIEIGYDFRVNAGLPARFFIGAGVLIEYPFENMLLPHPAIEAGIAWYFGEGE
ncbi:MAG: hypothetical protein A2Y33_10560 [Spirochaetes bacterium GWF1_51_8]|nr:MAG: hypothetical protein A2Y33_10560 [Spirochaetes bacterium GWF1_51_8]